ncbi:hypothetical protein LCGC14_2486530, partial [marine sediment metagenome]
LPTPGQLADGDGIFGIWLGDTDTNATVGDGGGSTYRGLASTTTAFSYTQTVTETSGGTLGPMFLATAGSTFNFNGATVTADGGNTVKLYGAGTYEIEAGTTFNTDLEMNGPGRVQIFAVNGIAGRTLTMNDGELYLDWDDALGSATAVINSGALIYEWANASAGTIIVKDGGGIVLDGPGFATVADLAGGATWDIRAGAQIVQQGTGWATGFGDVSASDGKASWLYFSDYRGTGLTPSQLPPRDGTYKLVLGDTSRMTIAPVASPLVLNSHTVGRNFGGDYGIILLDTANNQSQMRLAAPDGLTFRLQANLDLDLDGVAGGEAGTLIIGDPNSYQATLLNGGGMVALSQGGTVQLAVDDTEPINNVGKVNVVAGILYLSDDGLHLAPAQIGGATEVRLAAGTRLHLHRTTPTFSTVFTGDGTIDLFNNGAQAIGTLNLVPTGTMAAGISPGDSAGIFTVEDNLTLSSVATGGGTAYATVNIEVVGTSTTGAVAGTHFDRLLVTG